LFETRSTGKKDGAREQESREGRREGNDSKLWDAKDSNNRMARQR